MIKPAVWLPKFLCVATPVILGACATPSNFVQAAAVAHDSECPDRAIAFERTSPDAINIALSGGGYRAMLFHVGALWRLHELGILREAAMVSSVSGGSLAAGVLAVQQRRIATDWTEPTARQGQLELGSRCFKALVAEPLMRLAKVTIDWKAALGLLLTSSTPLANYYGDYLFGDIRLQELNGDTKFLFQATSLHTGSLWSFSSGSMGDAQIGYWETTTTTLATAVAASSAFPPFLSPVRVAMPTSSKPTKPAAPYSTEWNQRNFAAGAPQARATPEEIERIRARGEVLLTDGGVADNLGLEGIRFAPGVTLVSDGGSAPIALVDPPLDWTSQVARVISLIHEQPTKIRAHLLVRDFGAAGFGGMDGAYWSISNPLPRHLEEIYCAAPRVERSVRTRLAHISTRLEALADLEIKELINWGYHATDWYMPYLNERMAQRLHVISDRLPFPEAPLWDREGASQEDSGCH